MATKVQRIMTQPIVRQLRDRSLQSHVSTVELRADDSSSLSRVAKRPPAPRHDRTQTFPAEQHELQRHTPRNPPPTSP